MGGQSSCGHFQFHFDDLACLSACVAEIVGDFAVDVAEVAGADFVRGGLAVG